jgi:flagellar biosynthetic protein FliR
MLAETLRSDAFAAVVLFVRIGTAVAFLPGFGAAYVAMRIRLVIALALTVLVTPTLAGSLPAMPTTPAGLGILLMCEAAVGFFLGSVARIAFAALQTAGTFIAYLSSFANALIQDPVADQQSSTISGFLSALGLVAVFVTDLHHLMLRGIVDSYGVFTPGSLVAPADFAAAIEGAVADSFKLGVQLAAPFLIVSLVYNVGLGLLGRLMPQLPVFFFGLPLQLGLQMWVMLLTLSAMILLFLNGFGELLAGGFGG